MVKENAENGGLLVKVAGIKGKKDFIKLTT